VVPASVLPVSGAPLSTGGWTCGHAVPASAHFVLRVPLSNGWQVEFVHADSSCDLVCGFDGHASPPASASGVVPSEPEDDPDSAASGVVTSCPTAPSSAPTT
jgi:hypothetical protein